MLAKVNVVYTQIVYFLPSTLIVSPNKYQMNVLNSHTKTQAHTGLPYPCEQT